jgi:AcrR family transcriptional regulator
MPPARERILKVASRLHRKHGLEALSLRAVAAEVGVTPMAIYRHFRDKDALVAALVEAGFARWEQYLAEAVTASTPLEIIERALLAYAEFALHEPNVFRLMFLTVRPSIPAAPASLASSPSPSAQALIVAMHRAIEAGVVVRDDPAELILLCWATMHGLIALHFSGRFGHDDDVFRAIYDKEVRRLLRLLSG